MKEDIVLEITPLTPSDCFVLFTRVKERFSFPLHYHEEFELNFISNASGSQRIIGNRVDEIGDLDLVLIGPNVNHGRLNHRCRSKEIVEVTVQFHKELFCNSFLNKNQLSSIRSMLEQSGKGLFFSAETIVQVKDRLRTLKDKTGFNSVLELMSILNFLSQATDTTTLCQDEPVSPVHANSQRLHYIYEYMNKNYKAPLTLRDVAAFANMSKVSLSRFIHKRTGKTFFESLNEIRLGHATRLLIDTSQTISEIAYGCGFNNVSNFNRIFKRKTQFTPKEFRHNFSGAGIHA